MLAFPSPLPPTKFQNTLEEIKSLSTALSFIPLNQTQQQHIFHTQFLKSSLFSARIEGNKLTLTEAAYTKLDTPKEKNKLEVSNVLTSLKTLSKITTPFSIESLKSIHQQVMKNLDPKAGHFRTESSAIYNQYGNIIYLTPEPNEAQQMIDVLIKKINSHTSNNLQNLLHIPACHYYFEKIHPFMDGNGRTGRVLLQYQLSRTKLFHGYIIPIEEYFDNLRDEYYFYLERNTTNLESLTQFFLEGISWSIQKILEDIKNLSNRPQNLLPRRQEIHHIIEDHPYITLENIARRFPTIPKRTIAYDVQQLVKKGLINKHGQTRGVMYTALKH